MDRPFISTRDLFLAPAACLCIFLVAQRIAYVSQQWRLTLAALVCLPIAFAYLGARLAGRLRGALNGWSIFSAVFLMLFAMKWWSELFA